MRKTALALASALSCVLAGGASAQQFQAQSDINDGSSTSSAYFGTGFTGSSVGAVFDGGRDAFDTYGVYTGALNGLLFARQTELFADQNLYRFYDTFYNFTGSTIATTLTFGGDLGSDGLSSIKHSGGGLYVTCLGTVSGCFNEPVIAHVGGSAALQGLAFDDYTATFNISVAPGQAVSLLNFAFLASSLGGTNASDITLAVNKGQALLANPYVNGLNAAQQARIVNFTGAPPPPPPPPGGGAVVPEPTTWGLMILGFGGAGAALRANRRRFAPA